MSGKQTIGSRLWAPVLLGAGLVGLGFAATTRSSEPTGKEWTADLGGGVQMKFVRIQPGEFKMGSPADEQGRFDDEAQHRVQITKAFYLGIYEVTQAQYERLTGNNPSCYKAPKYPVECVSWDEAVAFCRTASEKTGKTVRLPTEAEWEYACRAGTTTRFSCGGEGALGTVAWFGEGRDQTLHPVGAKKPNAWGLYDMHGNVWEWCSDRYSEYGGDAVDPTGAAEGTDRVLRGGAWNSGADQCRSACRMWNRPDSRSYKHTHGFRVVVDVR